MNIAARIPGAKGRTAPLQVIKLEKLADLTIVANADVYEPEDCPRCGHELEELNERTKALSAPRLCPACGVHLGN